MSSGEMSVAIPDNSRVEEFGHYMCNYVFIRLGVIKGDPIPPSSLGGLFTENIGKAVMYNQMLVRNCLTGFFTCNFNRIVADVEAITYEFCSRIYAFSQVSFFRKFFQLSAFVLELFLYCRECSISEAELRRAPFVWKAIFDLVLKTDFYRQEGGWIQISMRADYYSGQLSCHFEPVIENLKDPYEELPDIAGLPDEFANTNKELHEVFETSYGPATLSYFKNIPPPIFLRQMDSDEGSSMDGRGRGCSSPSPKRFKRVHQVFDYY